MSSKTPQTSKLGSPEELERLRHDLATLQEEYNRVTMEKNFLERATQHLNFHNNAHDGVIYTDTQDRVVYANPYFLEMLGIQDKDEVLNQPIPDYLWNRADEADRLLKDVKIDGFVREREMVLNNRAGEPVFAMCSGVASRDQDGQVIGTEIMFCNITSKRLVQAELLEQQALLDAILQSTPDPTLILSPAMQVEHSTAAAQSLFRLPAESSDQSLYTLFGQVGIEAQMIENTMALFQAGQKFRTELELNAKYFELHAAPLQGKQEGWVCVFHDITERKRTEKNLQYHAQHDMLTQLPNRSYFHEKLDRIIRRYQNGTSGSFAVLFIDLDKLKLVNDSYGHHVGDQFLIEFSRRLEMCVRPGDMVGRLGGDEFAVYLDAVEDQEEAMKITERLHAPLRQPYKLLDQYEVQSAASIGIALFEDGITSAEDLLLKADKAMYRAKRGGGDTYRI